MLFQINGVLLPLDGDLKTLMAILFKAQYLWKLLLYTKMAKK
jgi:hypothetical protein